MFFDNATYKDVSGSAKFTNEETADFLAQIDRLEKLLANVPRNLSNLFGANQDFVPFFQMYINAMVKQGQLPGNSNQFIKGFQKFYIDRMQQQISGLKAEKALKLRQDKIKQKKQIDVSGEPSFGERERGHGQKSNGRAKRNIPWVC